MTTYRRVAKIVTAHTEARGPHLGDIAPKTYHVVTWEADQGGDYIEINYGGGSLGYVHTLDWTRHARNYNHPEFAA